METENFRAHFQQQPDGWINYDSFVRGKSEKKNVY